MKQIWRRLFSGIILISLILILSACNSTAPAEQVKAVITVTDQSGRTVSFDKIPQRIISISPSSTEIVYALNLQDRLVGRTDYCNYPPEAQEKPSIGGFSNPNIEQIIALEPDLILGASLHETQILPQLEEKGVNVLILDPITIDEVLQAFTLVGEVTGTQNNTANLVSNLQQRLKIIDNKIGQLFPDQKPGVFYVVWYDPLMVAGEQTLIYDLITRAGGTNLATTSGYYTTVSLESLIQANPEVLIAGSTHGDDGDQTYQFISGEPRLQSTEARKSGAIYEIDGDLSSRYGPRLFDALEQFAQFIHPELFKASK